MLIHFVAPTDRAVRHVVGEPFVHSGRGQHLADAVRREHQVVRVQLADGRLAPASEPRKRDDAAQPAVRVYGVGMLLRRHIPLMRCNRPTRVLLAWPRNAVKRILSEQPLAIHPEAARPVEDAGQPAQLSIEAAVTDRPRLAVSATRLAVLARS
ncbi:MAG: hypothetical protein ACREM1_10150 [Longimicrobiales bacterium]